MLPAMKIKLDINKFWRRWGCLTLSTSHLLAIAITAACFLLYWHLPAWLGEKLLPQLAAACGIQGIKADVRTLGITGATFERVRMELDGSRVIAADSIQIAYRLPWWPLERQWQIKALTIDGARIKIVRDGDKWHIPGIYPELFQPRPGKPAQSNAKDETKAAFNLKSITLNRCTLQFEQDKRRLEFPFNLRIKSPDGLGKNIGISAKLQCGNDTIKGKGEFDRRDGRINFNLSGTINLDNYLPFFQPESNVAAGKMAFAGDIFGKVPSTGPRRLAGNIKLNKMHFSSAGWNLINWDKNPVAVRLKLTGNSLEYSLSNSAITGIATLLLEKNSGVIIQDGNGITARGSIDSIISANQPQPFKLESDLSITHSYDFSWQSATTAGVWHYRANAVNDGAKPLNFTLNRGILSCDALQLSADGMINCNRLNGQYDYTADTKLNAGGKIRWKSIPAGLKAETLMPQVTMKIKHDNTGFANYLMLNAADIVLPEQLVKTGEVKITLPLPGNAEPYRRGTITLEQLQRRNALFGALALTVENTSEKISVDGIFKPLILPGGDWKICGTIIPGPLFSAAVQVDAGPYRLSQPLELEKIMPQLSGLNFNGTLEAHARYQFSADTKYGSATVSVTDGEIIGAEKGINGSGVTVRLAFPRLPELVTLPGQIVSCRNLKIGSFNFDTIELDYQIEPGMAVLLENFSAGCCGGKIYTQALRLTPGQKNHRMVVYADGLVLSRLIGESGIANAVGGGLVHGRLPVNFGADGIVLEPGFLYSAPDDKQNIQIAGMEKLIEGVPPESMQYSQMDVAAEALKNFDYEWIKINFNNSGENLLLEMQLNGKPALPLPFKYDPQRGGFIRVKGESAVFQGIRLNVNTSLPLNRLLKFNNSIKELTGGKKP